MTDDVRISTGFKGHRKTKRLKRLLGAAACWSLTCLWAFTAESHWTGDLTGLSDDDIEEESDWDGPRGKFVEALIEVRFMDGEPGARRVHDWTDHNPYAAGKGHRITRGKTGARAKWASSDMFDGDQAPELTNAQKRSQRLAAARAKGTHTDEEWTALVAICGHHCVRCLAEGKLVKDHIQPIYQEGSDSIDNLQPLCARCNNSKGPERTDFRPLDWAQRLRDACPIANNASPPTPAPTPTPTHTPSETPAATGGSGHSDSVGVFEGQVSSEKPTIATAVTAAIELRKIGLNITGQNPDLIAAMGEGVMVQHLLDAAAANPGKPPKYLITLCRRERSEGAAPIATGGGSSPGRGNVPAFNPDGPSPKRETETKHQTLLAWARQQHSYNLITAETLRAWEALSEAELAAEVVKFTKASLPPFIKPDPPAAEEAP